MYREIWSGQGEERVSDKSIEILKELNQYLLTGALSIEEFPKQDLLGMVHAEHDRRLKEQFSNLGEYIAIYDLLIGDALAERNVNGLTDLVDRLIGDLQGTSSVSSDGMDRLRQVSDPVIVKRYQQKAKAVYERYPFQSLKGEVAFQGKGVIYTVITGDYDVLRDPEYVDPSFDYICFTDNKKLRSEVWNVSYLENFQKMDNARLSRKPKILCHKFLEEYDYSIYVDGKIQIIGNLREYIERYSKGSPMLCFPHFTRECAYEESIACINSNADNSETIKRQMDEYRSEGYPVNNGLIDAACMVRRHDDEILQKVMECWWEEVRTKSRRDQLSIGYACWKNNFHYDLSDLFIYKNDYICKRRDRERPF